MLYRVIVLLHVISTFGFFALAWRIGLLAAASAGLYLRQSSKAQMA